ncbi:MAG: RNA polymerase sigma-70 factor [Candidatus Pseudobacter hemicellulosilyticus]|uniref:RNA polymerase sigma-70 factor n=1 Tax=Candidatus Pseudobacter hemicellulosilyticus TaxID=3121375 RepID=A0AAJ5WWV5_9BACT|nr:MAG: RNA polymerase sigma-70 factor [Pseudobacter sp.]
MPNPDNIKELQRRIAVYDDQLAYKDLFFHFYKPLQQFAFSFVRSHEMAEEIVSDVFIRIWERRQQIEEIENLKVYLYVSTRNTSLKYLLKQQKQVAVTIDELQVELEGQYNNPEQLLITAEMMARVQAAIDELPPRCKIVYKLIREDGLKYKEVSEILNISVKTIDNQLAIALRKIGKAINVNLRKVIRF